MHPLIESYYAAFNSGDREALLEMLTDDVVHEINEGATETGKGAFEYPAPAADPGNLIPPIPCRHSTRNVKPWCLWIHPRGLEKRPLVPE